MGLNVRLCNISCDNDFDVEYTISGYSGSFTFVGTYTQGTSEVIIENLDFDTRYFVKITDKITGQYVTQTIITNNELCFNC